MAGKGNYRKRKLDTESSQTNEEMSCLSAGSKLVQLVIDGNIKDVITVLKYVPKNSKCLDAAFIKVAEFGHKRMLQKFIEKGVSINNKNIHGDTALHIATMHGYIDLVKHLVRNGAVVNCQNNDGQTPLMLGVKKASSLPLIEYLLSGDCCADVNCQDYHGRTALMISTELQDFCAMKILMSHKEINLGLKDENGKTAFDIAKDCGIQELFRTFRLFGLKEMSVKPLIFAIKKRNVNLVRSVLYTITHKEINTLDENLYSPLMISVIEKCANVEIIRMLVKAGADVNKTSPNENVTPLFLACKAGCLDAVKILVKEGANVNYQTDGLKLTPLMCACENNATEIVKFLIKKKANINLKNSSNETALTLALNSCKKKDCVECLIKNGAEINDNVLQLAVQVGCYKLLPNVDVHVSKGVLNEILMLACVDLNYDLAKFVLEHGADVNHQGNGFKPPLFLALGSIHLVNLLLKFGANVNVTNIIGHTPLMEAAHLDDRVIIETLIKHGADIDASDAHGFTALIVAAREEKLTALECLMDSGANLNYMSTNDFFSCSALNAAFDTGKMESVKLLLKRGANVNMATNPPLFQSVLGDAIGITLCLNHGADPNLQNSDGLTALMFALVRRCDHNKIKLLLDAGADPNIRNKDGETALILAAKYCTTPVLDLLIKRGADITATDREGSTALLCAVTHSIANDSKISLLISCGVDINKSNTKGHSPLILAAQGCHLNIVQLLVDKGANVNAQDHNGATALMAAAAAGNHKKVKYLIDCKADVNIRTCNGTTAAVLAANAAILTADAATMAAKDEAKTLKALLDAGADMSAVNEQGVSVLSRLLSHLYDWTHASPPAGIFSCLKVGLEAGVKPDMRNPKNALLFHKLLVRYDEPELVYLFMKTGSAPPLISFSALRSICTISSRYSLPPGNKKLVSPLLTAMFSKNTNMVFCFLKYWYLDKTDVKLLQSSSIHNLIFRENVPHSFHSIINEPFSLKCLSFLVVSTAVGSHHDRESRVNALPIPSVMKNTLLFQTHKHCLPDLKVKEFSQRTQFLNYTQQGLVGLDALD